MDGGQPGKPLTAGWYRSGRRLEQTVGERRYWDARVAGTEVSRAVRIPYGSAVERGDVFIIEGKQYEVVQKDLKDDRLPASWLLSLASVQIGYRQE